MKSTGLFEETKFPTVKTPAPFKLSDWHDKYVAHNDPTEYGPAMELVGSWSHWLALRKNQTLGLIFDEWKMEVEVKIRSEAVLNIVTQSRSATGTAAARWLAEAGFNPKDLRNKKSRDREEQIKERMASRVEADLNRITGRDKE